MRQHFLTGALALALAATLSARSPVCAGVVPISQSRALAGKISPGDTQGFPVTITRPGSYQLRGNLTAPAGVDGISIAADDITLDLNGFRIMGSGGTGITGIAGFRRIEITHGTIIGFGTGINLMENEQVILRDIRTDGTSTLSLVVGPYSSIQRNNAQGLIQAECPSILTENLTLGFITVVVNASGAQCVRWNNRSLNFTGAVTQ